MASQQKSRSIEELRNYAKILGLILSQDGAKWLVVKADTTIVAKEQSERMALACAIARTEAGVFDEN
jgi:hypothetical protein